MVTAKLIIGNLPIMLLVLLFEFFNIVHLPPNEYTSGSDSNLFGLFLGNFVYDGPFNIYFIVGPSILAIFSVCTLSSTVRMPVSKRFVLSALTSAVVGYSMGLSLWNTLLHWDCLSPCNFWGMSAVAGGSTGSALGLSMLVFVMAADKKKIFDPHGLFFKRTRLSRVIAFCAFGLSLASLMIFLPDAFSRQTFLVMMVHASSLMSGLILSAGFVFSVFRKVENGKPGVPLSA
jgi:hypothetical protein